MKLTETDKMICTRIIVRAVESIRTPVRMFTVATVIERIEALQVKWEEEATVLILGIQATGNTGSMDGDTVDISDTLLGAMFEIVSNKYNEEEAEDINELILKWWDEALMLNRPM